MNKKIIIYIIIIIIVFVIAGVGLFVLLKNSNGVNSNLNINNSNPSPTPIVFVYEPTQYDKENCAKTKEEPKSEQKDTTGANASSKDTGKVELIVKWPPSYQVKESGTFKKAVIDQMYFTVINSLSTDITPKVNIYFWDSSSSDGFKTSVKDTVTIQTMRPSTKVESSYKVDNLNLYNLDLTKTFKFEIVYGKKNASVLKTLDIE